MEEFFPKSSHATPKFESQFQGQAKTKTISEAKLIKPKPLAFSGIQIFT